MNASIISALAALVGATIGGLTSVLASWLTQLTQAKARWIAQDRARLQELYKEFIEEASKSYVVFAMSAICPLSISSRTLSVRFCERQEM